jgi:FAD/FMN-containing dehydrogenase
MKEIFSVTLKVFFATILLLVAGLTIVFFSVTGEPEGWKESGKVNDVTQLNPVPVSQELQPQTSIEISNLIRDQVGPISIGGARHSMGGQIASDSALYLDMRSFNKIVSFSKEQKQITVQSGITWRAIQEYIDPHDLSVSIMQTYANFTVGGSLSVNVHGRYIGQGAIVHSVRSLKLILANGEIVDCSPDLNSELFYGCIGGYGALGVIAEVTLQLTDNCRVKRLSETMNVTAYKEYFIKNIRNDSTVVFQNADLYPNNFTEVRSVSYVKTSEAVTVEDRLKPMKVSYRWERFAMWLVSELSGGQWLRQEIVDPMYYNSEKIVWRNYEASYDANELEPASRNEYTYVLQEYFVPVEEFDSFVPLMAEIFKRNKVNVINVSIRHARKDDKSLLSWSSEEVFCFVVYYKQGTSTKDQETVGKWTRELIDAALSKNGSYYLPYQLHATPQQFEKAYRRSEEFFTLKSRIDSMNRFTNKLWDKYYLPVDTN